MEQLRIEVTIDVGQGVAALQAILAQMQAVNSSAGSTTQTFNQLTAQVNNTANTFNQTNNTVNQTNQTLNQTNQTVNAFQQNLTQANSTVNNTSNSLTNFNLHLHDAEERTSGLATQVTRWIGAYAGMQTVFRIIDDYLARMKQVAEAQQQLVGSKLGDDEQLKEVMQNLGVSGQRGQAKARRLQQSILANAPVNTASANAALKIANSSGHDPRTGEGMAFATQIAATMARENLSEEDALELVRSLGARGLDTTQGLKTAVAKNDALFRVSKSTSPSAFLSNFVRGVMPAMGKGVDADVAGSIYSGFLGLTASEQEASQAATQALYFAQSPTKQSREYFARQAAHLGVTNVKPVTDRDVESMLASRGGKDAISLLNERRLIQGESTSLSDAERGLEDAGGVFGSRRHKPAETAAHKDDMQRRQDDLQKRRAALEERQHRADEKLAKLKEDETSRREVEAYNSVGLADRLQRVVTPTVQAARASDEATNLLGEATGTSVRRRDKVMMLGDSSVQAQIARALAAARSANAGQTDQANSDYSQTSTAQWQKNENDIHIANTNAVGPTELFAQMMLQQAQSAVVRKAQAGGYLSKGGSLGDVAVQQFLSKQGRQIPTAELEIMGREVASMNASLTPQQKKFIGWDDLLSKWKETMSNPSMMTDEGMALGAGALAIKLGEKKEALQMMSQRAGATASAPQSAPPITAIQPTTQPAAAPGHPTPEQQKVINYYHNYVTHIGSVYTHSPDLDLPGALEQH